MTDMLQKSENVAKNVANKNSQDLTEQWKRGEFIICNAGKCQYYYVQNEEQREVIKTEYCLFDDNTPNWQILAPVPTFDEWKQAQEQLHKEGIWYTEISHKKVLKENVQLKELLKECKHIMSIEKDFASCHFEKDKLCKLLTKINQVLGEE